MTHYENKSSKEPRKNILRMLAMAGLQAMLFIVLVSVVQTAFPPQHWGVPEGIGLCLLLLVFIALALVNAVVMEGHTHWWIPMVIAATFCASSILFDRGFSLSYPHRSVAFLIIALLSFALPFGLKSFFQKREKTP